MAGLRKKYDAAFKRETIELAAHSEKPDRTIEQDLGLYQGAIRQWRQALGHDPAAPPSGVPLSAEEELRRLRRELADVRTERDILKKAMAIFTKER